MVTGLMSVEGVPVVGKKYHVAWAYSNGIVGVCVSVNESNKIVILRTPKTKRLFKKPVHWIDLRYTRHDELIQKSNGK